MITIRTHQRRAFTLVEMLVAISIVILLAALTITATQVLGARQQVRATETTMQLLDVAVQEFEATADRAISWGYDGAPDPPGTTIYDMKAEMPHAFTVTEILQTIRRAPDVSAVLKQIDPDVMVTYDTSLSGADRPLWINTPDPNDPDPNVGNTGNAFDSFNGEIAVIDSWGIPIRAVHPGRVASVPIFGSGDDTFDADGTVRLSLAFNAYGVEEIYGTVKDRRICFVSAGPDRRFGSRAPGASDELRALAADNIYSYEIEEYEP